MLDQVAPAAPAQRPAQRPSSSGGGPPPGPAASAQQRPAAASSQTGRFRKIEATPLQQNIRTGPAAAPAPRKVEIQGESKFPWAVVGLVVLIAGAAVAILASLGFLGGTE